MPILTRTLSKHDYGILSVVEALILMLTPLMLFNSTSFLSARYYKLTKAQVALTNVNALFLGCGIFIFTQGLFFVFSDWMESKIGVPYYFLELIPLFVFFRLLNTYLGNLWQIQHNVRAYGIFSIGTLTVDLVLSLLLVIVFNLGYVGRLVGSHLSFLLFSLLAFYFLKKEGLLQGRVKKTELLSIFYFGAPLIPHALGGVSLAIANRYLLANYMSSEAVATFVVAYQIASVMLLVGTSINQAWSVYLFQLLADGARQNRMKIRKIMLVLLTLLGIAFCSILLFQDVLFSLLAGKNFDASKPYFPYLLGGFFFQSLYFVFVNFDFYEERVASIGFTTIAAAAVNIVINIALIPIYGTWGAVYAALGSMALYFFLVLARVIMFNKNFREVWF